MTSDEVRLRLLRADDIPATNPHNLAYKFGLQDTKQEIMEGRRLPNGKLAFDFTLKVKKGRNAEQPVFTGRDAGGPIDDRFVYLSWLAISHGDYINRVKARLSNIDWKMIHAAQEQGKVIAADMTAWIPGDARKYVIWFLE